MSMSKPPQRAGAGWWRRTTGRISLATGVAVALVVIGGCNASPTPPAPAANAPAASDVVPSNAAAETVPATSAAARPSEAASTPTARTSAPPVITRSRTAAPSTTLTGSANSRSAPRLAAKPQPTPAQKSTPSTTTTPAAAQPDTALAASATLTVKGRAPMTGYSRDQFGQAWADIDRNGCDQRNDVLRRDLTALTIKADTYGCAVLTGVLHDPYTGATISFTRGETTSAAVQIDHIVALGNAWVTGAAQWSPAARQQFANDPLELLAVSGPANEQKGDGDTATWLPANKSYRCQYVARQIAVKSRYHLAVTTPELGAMHAVLATCPLQALPIASVIPLDTTDTATPTQPPAVTTRSTQPARLIPAVPKTTTPPTTQTPVPAQNDVYYQNCAAVRAAGKAPLHTGDPGYSTKLDRDRDGTACEN